LDISLLDEQRVLVIIRHNSPFNIGTVFQAVMNGGLNIIEITLNTPGAHKLIETAAGLYGSKMLIGAGTVLTLTSLKEALSCGAQFIVSPVFKREIVEYCASRNIPVFPGALTPTEVCDAYESGAYMVKLFPASVQGPAYIKSIKAPFPDIKIMAVGGINKNNARDFLDSGAKAVAIGAGIIRPEWVEHENQEAITSAIVEFRNAI
jgi:2-dehydro-3-deoxyphosphogluconate aldolase / (4S)-4-hydroxy-2-oxoglutarate aldolase